MSRPVWRRLWVDGRAAHRILDGPCSRRSVVPMRMGLVMDIHRSAPFRPVIRRAKRRRRFRLRSVVRGHKSAYGLRTRVDQGQYGPKQDLGTVSRAPLRAPPNVPIAPALMNIAPKTSFVLRQRHLLGIEGLSSEDIAGLLDLAEEFVALNRQIEKKRASLRGRTQINLFFESSTRTQSSFELAGKRLGADVMNMSVGISAMRKGETLLDTAITLNAMRPDILVVRHHASGAVELLAQKVDGSVINAGDGAHEHPTQALLDALTIRRNKARIERLTVAICGDILHSRVARSNILLLNALGARVRVVAPSTLLPAGIEQLGVEVCRDMREGLADADIVMMLRLQRERMNGSLVPSVQEYFHYYGLDQKKLGYARPDALVMHPGPMNRGVEIDSSVADGAQSLIREQVEMGVAVRMAVLEALSRNLPNA